MIGHGRLIADVSTVTLYPTSLNVRRQNSEHVSRPRAGLEARPRMASKGRGMRTAVQPDRAIRAAIRAFDFERDHLSRVRRLHLRNPKCGGASERVGRNVWHALMLGH